MIESTQSEAGRIIDRAEALQAGPAVRPGEKRRHQRLPYHALVALVLRTARGERSRAIVLRAGDLSSGGLLVSSRSALPVGAGGVLQLVRPNGQFAIVGVRVKHCRYAGHLEHQCGLEFIPLPDGFTREEFLDAKGHVALLDPLLRQNCRQA